jgi:acyl-CoA synthetase (NDP forming)
MTSGLLQPKDHRDTTRARGPGLHAPSIDVLAEAADRSALRALLAPRSIAVVGAGRRHGSVGHETLRALRDYGFRGRLFAVNRSGRPACGVPAYRNVADLRVPIDLLILAVPADRTLPALVAASRLGARAALLLEAGWDTSDPAGARHRDQILRVAREHHIRLLGPGRLGVLNADPTVRLNASLAPVRPPAGGLAVAARSGGLGIALLQSAVRDRCGISTFVSVGDQSDITTGQLLAYWLDDQATRAVVLAHEPAADPCGDLARTVRAFARSKPVVAVTGGPPSSPQEGLVAQGGVVRTAGLNEALDAARMLVDQPLPAGSRMAIVGNAGDLTALAAGTARALGFDVVPLSGSTRAQLPYLAGSRRCDNPVDLGLGAAPDRIAAVAEAVAHSDEVDVLLLMLAGTRANVPVAITSALAPVLDGHPGLTVAAVLIGHTDEVHQLGDRGVPVFREPEQAVRALARSLQYAQWRRQPVGRPADVTALIGSPA